MSGRNIGDDETPAAVGPVDVGGRVSAVPLASLSRVYVSNRIASGRAAYVVLFSRPHQPVVVGDWDGDGVDGFAARSGNTYTLADEFGTVHTTIGYGKPGDDSYVGDWDGNGTDTFAVRRDNTIYIRSNLRSGVAQTVIGYGLAMDQLLVGDYDNDTIDTFAARRAPG